MLILNLQMSRDQLGEVYPHVLGWVSAELSSPVLLGSDVGQQHQKGSYQASMARWASPGPRMWHSWTAAGDQPQSNPLSVLCTTPCFGSQRHQCWAEWQASLYGSWCVYGGFHGVRRNGMRWKCLGVMQGGSCGMNQYPLRSVLISEGPLLGCNVMY